MYRNLPFHVKDYFLIKGKNYLQLLLRTAFVLAFLSFLSSFQLNAQNIALPHYIADHERKTVAAPLTHLVTGNASTHKAVNKLVIFCSMIGLSVVLFLSFRVKGNQQIFAKYVRNILPKTKNDTDRVLLKEDLHTLEISKLPAKSLDAISTETYNAILKKISKFEDSGKFLRKDINLTWLSNHLNTNTKYLSEVIKIHKGKNFNGYINGLRIRYIIQKLSETPVYRGYKISYLAEECGYASSQVFTIAFKRQTGVTPSHFIEQLKNEPAGDHSDQSSA